MAQDTRVKFIGEIQSQLTQMDACPMQGHEGAPAARLVIYPAFREAMEGIRPGSRLVVLTWLDKADRHVLKVHPRGNRNNPLTGVFLTRSPNRPNPVGLHDVRVLDVNETGLAVEPIEALNQTPVIDIKLALPEQS